MIDRVECVCAMTVRTGMPTKNIQNNEGNLCEFSLFFHRFQVSNSASKSDVISGWKKAPKMSAKSMPKSLKGDKGRPAGRKVVIENDFCDVSVGQNWGPEKQFKNHEKTTPGIRVPLPLPPPTSPPSSSLRSGLRANGSHMKYQTFKIMLNKCVKVGQLLKNETTKIKENI